jgi:hypothetical protein
MEGAEKVMLRKSQTDVVRYLRKEETKALLLAKVTQVRQRAREENF